MEKNKNEKNLFLFRYPPNTRFTLGSFKEQIEQPIIKEEFGESIVDKESYRLSLASKRGAIGNGSAQAGWYMFPDGQYNELNDFSYFMRKDLTVVDLDNYIKLQTDKLQNVDESLRASIQEQINQAKAYKESIKNDSKKEDSSGTGE